MTFAGTLSPPVVSTHTHTNLFSKKTRLELITKLFTCSEQCVASRFQWGNCELVSNWKLCSIHRWCHRCRYDAKLYRWAKTHRATEKNHRRSSSFRWGTFHFSLLVAYVRLFPLHLTNMFLFGNNYSSVKKSASFAPRALHLARTERLEGMKRSEL